MTSGLKLQPRINVKSVERRSSLSLLTLSWKTNKIKKNIEQKLIKPLFIEKSIILNKETTINFQLKN